MWGSSVKIQIETLPAHERFPQGGYSIPRASAASTRKTPIGALTEIKPPLFIDQAREAEEDAVDDKRKDDAPSRAAQRIEDELVDKTGRAAGDTGKSAQEKFDELGERESVKRSGGRA